MLKAVNRGAKLYVVDPRRTSSAKWADAWLGLNIGSDIALSNAMAYVIIEEGLADLAFIEHATLNFETFKASVQEYTPERAEALTGVPAEAIRDVARKYARSDRAMICWTLGITEHHNAVDNVLSLINLALLTGHVGKYGSGLNPLRGQNNVQGGGDMGAIPNRLAGFQDIRDPEVREKFERVWGVELQPDYGMHMTEMLAAMNDGKIKSLFVIGENPAQSEADQKHTEHLLTGLDHLVVQDIFMTRTAELADVVLPASSSWCESEGTVTNSERRVQRTRPALVPPGNAKDELWILAELARRLGHDWGHPSAEEVWNEVRSLAPMLAGMSYARLEAMGGIQWPCWNEEHPGDEFLHGRLWSEDVGEPAPFSVVVNDPPVEMPDASFPYQLTTGRRLDSYNTGVQSNDYASPLRRAESLDISPEDAHELHVAEGDLVTVSSRRGEVVAGVHIDEALRPGLVFMTFHYQDAVKVNVLTLDVTDPKSGTAEFKACAVSVVPVKQSEPDELDLILADVVRRGRRDVAGSASGD